ncbi:MAG: hypothetical protein AAB553_04030 [Patescibacteria group bacterium]
MKQQIQNIENFYKESKQFLKKIKGELQAAGNETPCGIVLNAADTKGKDKKAVLYEQYIYVILMPDGQKENALLYGNWDEALYASKKLLTNNLTKDPQVSIQQYTA